MDIGLVIAIIIGIVMTVATTAFLVWFMRRLVRQNTPAVKRSQVMDRPGFACPKCGKTMRQGFCYANSGIHWRAAGKVTGLFEYALTSTVPNTLNIGLRRKENMAWHCDSCQYLLFDYSKQVY